MWLPNPPIRLTTDRISEHAQALSQHLQDLQSHYVYPRHSFTEAAFPWSGTSGSSVDKGGGGGGVFMVNLIDKHKSQGDLGKCLAHSLDALQKESDILPASLSSSKQGNWRGLRRAARKEHVPASPKFEELLEDDLENRSAVTVKDYCLLLPSPLFEHTNEDRHIASALRRQQYRHDQAPLPLHARHIWFDFHAKCGGVLTPPPLDFRQGSFPWWEVLRHLDSAMYSRKAGRATLIGYFMNLNPAVKGAGMGPIPPREETGRVMQTSIIRTNCVDSLDRTNVLQVECM